MNSGSAASARAAVRGRFPGRRPRRQISANQAQGPRAAARRFTDATNTGDAELISKTIDEPARSSARHSPSKRQERKLKEVFARLQRAYPDLHVTIRI